MSIESLVLCLSLMLAITLIAPFISPYFRKIKVQHRQNNGKLPTVAVIIVAHDNAEELKEHLPIFLEQNYEGNFQAIVVADKGDLDTETVLETLSGHTELYATYLPQSSRYMSRKKLAITLGVKAAQTEWVIVTDANCKPPHNNWLTAFSQYLHEETDVVTSYVVEEASACSFRTYRRMWQMLYQSYFAARGKACLTSSPCVAFRKDLFLERQGFTGSLEYTCGEYEFLVNKLGATRSSTCAQIPDCRLLQKQRFSKLVKNDELGLLFIQRTLKRLWKLKSLIILDRIFLYAVPIFWIVSILFFLHSYNFIVLAASAFSILYTFIVRFILINLCIKKLQLQETSWKPCFFDYIHPWISLKWKISKWMADNYDFTSHKV